MKKIISLLICFIIICSTFSLNVNASILSNGSCGNNLTWELDTDGELTICGSGDMYNFDNGGGWYVFSPLIKEIILPEELTYIGNYVFYGCEKIEEVQIPDAVTEIGYSAFKNCTSLASISLPSEVKIIGSSAFEGCTNLVSIKLPDYLQNIYHFTFAMCKNLKEIEISDGVKDIGQGAFTNCSSLATVHIPSTVEKIGNRTFYGCNSLNTIYYGGTRTQWENITIGSGNSVLDNVEVICLTEEEIIHKQICFICDDEIVDDIVFYDDEGNTICKLCNDELQEEKKKAQENETKICFSCETEIKDNDEFYDENDNLICQDCYNYLQELEEETEEMICQYCDENFYITDDVYDKNSNIICPYCDENLTQEKDEEEQYYIECPHCGENFKDSQAVYDEDGYEICPYCDEIIYDIEENTEETEIEFITSDWATEEVYEAYQNNLIPDGMLEDTLYDTITREEFAAIAVKLYENIVGDVPYVDIDDMSFTDCDYESEYISYIAIAYELGITKGTSLSTFSPYDNISREQLATMLYRVIKLAENDKTYDFDVNNVRKFYDDSEISAYAKESVYFMAEYGIVKGVDGAHFAPLDTATKEQSILISVRCVNSIFEY